MTLESVDPGLKKSSFGPVVIDGKDHLVGRLAAVVAKEILNGRQVTVVRAEKLNVSGSLYRNKLKYKDYLRKRCLVNPARGPFHHRAPSKMFFKAVRGMVPHKKKRGSMALHRLSVFDGVPEKHAHDRRLAVPAAARQYCLRQDRKYTVLGRLSQEFGWRYAKVVQRDEKARIEKAVSSFKERQEKSKAPREQPKELQEVADKLRKLGYPGMHKARITKQ